MIQLTKGITNSVPFTLTEKTTLNPVYYLLELIPKGNNTPVYCVLGTDKSTSPQRYNEFDLIEKSTPNNLNSEIEVPVGESIYNVYEQANNSNLDPAGLNCVEGPMRCWVTKTVNSDIKIKNTDLTNIEVHG